MPLMPLFATVAQGRIVGRKCHNEAVIKHSIRIRTGSHKILMHKYDLIYFAYEMSDG